MRRVALLFGLGLSFLAPRDAFASASWGDAVLVGDDISVDVDSKGMGRVVHSLSIHVTGKKFRSFHLDQVDADLSPPREVNERDGPSWPIEARDGHGDVIEAYVEPAKEPRRLRVRLGRDGVGRGEYRLVLRYDVDFLRGHAFSRVGQDLRFQWAAPRWPDGLDTARITLRFPSAPTEPHAAIVDGGEGDRTIDGVAISELRRNPARDELTLLRPHIPALDDTMFRIHLDRRALPTIDEALGAERSNNRPIGLRSRLWDIGLSIGSALFTGLFLWLRNRSLARRDRKQGQEPFRALFRIPGVSTAGFGVMSGLASWLVLDGQPILGALSVLVATPLASSFEQSRDLVRLARGGTFLAVPFPSTVRLGSVFDLGTRKGRLFALALTCTFVASLAILLKFAPTSYALALLILGYPTFAMMHLARSTNRTDAVTRARRLDTVRAHLKSRGIDSRMVGHVSGELRLRLGAFTDIAGLRAVEIGCATEFGLLRNWVVLEVLLRWDVDANPVRRLVQLGHVAYLGRNKDEVVVLLRGTRDEAVDLVKSLTDVLDRERSAVAIAA